MALYAVDGDGDGANELVAAFAPAVRATAGKHLVTIVRRGREPFALATIAR